MIKEGQFINVNGIDELHFSLANKETEMKFAESYYNVMENLNKYKIASLDEDRFLIYPEGKMISFKYNTDTNNSIFWDINSNIICVLGMDNLEKLAYTLELNRTNNIVKLSSYSEKHYYLRELSSNFYKEFIKINSKTLFTKDGYRRYLEEYFINPLDKNKIDFNKRFIDNMSDELLQKIIDDTNIFIDYVMDKMVDDNHVVNGCAITHIKLNDDIHHISNMNSSIWCVDELFSPSVFGNNALVSKKILASFFEGFLIYFHEDNNEMYIDISGMVSSFLKLCTTREKEHRTELVKVLKLVQNKNLR